MDEITCGGETRYIVGDVISSSMASVVLGRPISGSNLLYLFEITSPTSWIKCYVKKSVQRDRHGVGVAISAYIIIPFITCQSQVVWYL